MTELTNTVIGALVSALLVWVGTHFRSLTREVRTASDGQVRTNTILTGLNGTNGLVGKVTDHEQRIGAIEIDRGKKLVDYENVKERLTSVETVIDRQRDRRAGER